VSAAADNPHELRSRRWRAGTGGWRWTPPSQRRGSGFLFVNPCWPGAFHRFSVDVSLNFGYASFRLQIQTPAGEQQWELAVAFKPEKRSRRLVSRVELKITSAGCPTDPGAGGGAAVGGAGRFRDRKKIAGRAGALHCGSARRRGAPGRCGQVLDLFIFQKISLKLVFFQIQGRSEVFDGALIGHATSAKFAGSFGRFRSGRLGCRRLSRQRARPKTLKHGAPHGIVARCGKAEARETQTM